ncbi:tRNA glutamyl-Q(34) synthetase GluQRS [Desulfuromonas acetoxidans]|uniref:Glutamyl-Q tRNA(Asp) synthetase n=1 Tax=Desulfuromonas acetoxidans (strain DSM 684 / 11070) TaxID=281689 RepID=Q1JXQ2_DESA6|nr:tRNA glutamyl-Q(34) synthetase GluQRS [Desulfuromonas acetoxidans]EAT15091.1 Glutamate--tRNA ligase [Desulfuromonas acetoxidans DSM 684]MBF0645478.1 tRNA glutamyl-Q(34) synthetase GluQRS [Desulfuromonas acetoxidans]NVD25321.1 tRNA glutamyl-Q(34) synthetase GluQRS [Desulfuromonas acetoxidans]NVE17373.1 tRNA glutamyl-Q(34) synthetase GluQRS [Desulfuromonas acetoxidans]
MKNTCSSAIVGRFAPSPTGPLHLGSIIAAVASYLTAKQSPQGRWLVRIDDLDQPRTVPGASATILDHLQRLGLHHDGPVMYQSQRHERYQEVLTQLTKQGWTYSCSCSRKEILASAPHQGEEGPIYPGTCLYSQPPFGRPTSCRVQTRDELIRFTDLIQGTFTQNLRHDVGDFVLQRNDGIFAYQLATVIDDHDSGVNLVVRGRDLLTSTPRQIYLLQCLNWSIPRYAHIPLAMAEDGHKISKRHQQRSPCDLYSPQQLLCFVLTFLGLDPPQTLVNASVEALVQWGIDHFSFYRIPTNNRALDEFFNP